MTDTTPDSSTDSKPTPDAARAAAMLDDTRPRLDGANAARQEAAERAQRCGREVGEVLARYRCRLVPYVKPPEIVGQSGSKIQLEADVVILPDQTST